MKKLRIYLINIILIISIFLLVLYAKGVSPFGNNILGLSDGVYQFKPMLYDFIMKIKYGILESYSFNNGLGNPTIFNILYYLASPVNLIALLFNKPDTMYLAVILVKISIATISMTFYVSHKTDKKEVIIISTISYIFCTWFLIYYYYLTWIDAFMIFPLYQYGLEQIVNKKVSYIYIFSLAYMIMTSFYLSFSIAIYTLLYFIIYELIYKKNNLREKLKSFKRICIGTILSLLLSFVVIYSLCVFSSKSGVKLEGFSSSYYTDLEGLMRSVIYMQNSFVVAPEGYTFPNISCSIFILYNLFYFFLNRHITKRDKLYTLICIAIIISIITIPYLDFVLNFFHQIRGLTCRYGFIICFLTILFYIKNSENRLEEDEKDKIRMLLSFLILTIYILINLRNLFDENNYMGSGFVNMIFLSCYFILSFVSNNNKIDKMIMILIISLESIVGIVKVSIVYIDKENSIDNYPYLDNTTYRTNYIELPELIKEEDQNNFNLYNNQKSTKLMSSMTYSNVIYMIRDLGNRTFMNTAMRIEPNNYISRMLFNEKNDKYNLEKIYSVKKDIKKVKLKREDQFYNEKNTIYNMTGINILNENNNYNEERIKEAYEYLSKNQIKYTYYSDSRLEGNINVDNNQIIFTSIPYDKDWNIYIDGKKIKTIKVLNSLLAIETTPGKHKIILEYKEHLLIPFMVSLTTFIALIITIIRHKRRLQ